MLLPQVSGTFWRTSIYYSFLVVNLLTRWAWTDAAKAMSHLHTVGCYILLSQLQSHSEPICSVLLHWFWSVPLSFFAFGTSSFNLQVIQEDLSEAYKGESAISYSSRGSGISFLLGHLLSKTHRITAVLCTLLPICPIHLQAQGIRGFEGHWDT